MVNTAFKRGFNPLFIMFDCWYSGIENLKFFEIIVNFIASIINFIMNFIPMLIVYLVFFSIIYVIMSGRHRS